MIVNSILYFIYFFIFYILSFPKYLKFSEKITNYFAILTLLFFFGLRGYVATDYANYVLKYSEVPALFDRNFLSYWLNSSWEKGFVLFMCFSKTLSNNYFFFQFLNFLIDIILFNIFIKYFLPEKLQLIAYLCLFCFQGFIVEINLLRNSKAIMLFCVSLIYLKKKDYIKYYLLNILGFTFHTSAILYIIFPIFINLNLSKKIVIWLLIIGNVFFILRIKWIIPFVKVIFPFLGFSRLVNLVDVYLLMATNSEQYSMGLGFIERNFMCILVLKLQDSIITSNIDKRPFINMVYINNFIYLFCSEFLILTQRLPPLIAPGYWIMVPTLYEYLKSNSKKALYWVILLLYMTLKIGALTQNDYMKYSNALLQQQDYNKSVQMMLKEIGEEKKN